MHIRLLKSEKEYRACEEIQREVWGAPSATAELLAVIQNCGGVVLGAVEAGDVAGFLFALLARRNGRPIHWSHMMAVRENFRDAGLGFRMKLLHRRVALAGGIRSICWTYDPLQARNASLNVRRLGVVVEQYVPNYYGDFPSAIEKGLPSDRFVVRWNLNSSRVMRRLKGALPQSRGSSLPRINETRRDADGLLENGKISWSRSERLLAVEIPASTDAMRASAPDLARRWRMETRRIFQAYGTKSYRIAGFERENSTGGCRCYYILSRRIGRRC
ncbi:MAG: hypothetical protein ACRD2B_00335 [Terriglobia bacterium]